MRSIDSVQIFAATLLALLPVHSASAAFAGGDGSPGDPYQISTKEQLAEADNVLAYYSNNFVLINDIDVTGDPAYSLFPRANQGGRQDGFGTFGPAVGFSGTFDGAGFAIINKTNCLFDQLFSPFTGRNPTIMNLTLSNVNIRPHHIVQTPVAYAALSPGEQHSGVRATLLNVHVSGTVTSSLPNTGGLIGFAPGAYISNCTSSVRVFGATSAGGLIGSMSGSTTVTLCSATGDVDGTQDSGGLVGLMSGAVLLYQCSAHGDVTKSSGEYSGGLVGRIANGGTVRECFATGDFINNSTAQQGGCLVGGTEGASDILIEDCYSTGDHPSTTTMGPGRNGGFVGNFGRSGSGALHLINRCYAKGDVGSSIGGAFMGIDSSGSRAGVISNSYASGGAISNSNAGFGVFAAQYSIVNCFWTNNATSDSYATKVVNEAYFYKRANPPVNEWDSTTVWFFDGKRDPCLRWHSDCSPPPRGTVFRIE
jgi:hypothetical protein